MAKVIQQSQFSDPTISFNDAVSLCGPAAARAFAVANGRNPTLKEAWDLAEGWTQQGGMNGFQNQVKLLEKMRARGDVGDFEAAGAPDPQRVVASVREGKPVTISTGFHYFTVSDHDPATGKFYVGTSGTDVKGGGEWWTLDEMDKVSRQRVGSGINGTIYMTSAPTDPPSRERQQFLEQNAPGESTVPAPKPPKPATDPVFAYIMGDSPTPSPIDPLPAVDPVQSTPRRTSTAQQETPNQKAAREFRENSGMYEQFSKRIQGGFGEPLDVPSFTLPSLSVPEMPLPSFRPPPLAPTPRRFVLGV